MVKTQNLTPHVYYNKSRDFQLIGRVYDLIFNYLKTNTDTIYNNPLSYNSDETLLDLMATTFGFKKKHQYNTKQLQSLCSIFMLAIKNKGNLSSIEYLLNMLANVESATTKCTVDVDENEPWVLKVYIPLTIQDVTIFQDMLDYVLPAGMSCRITRQVVAELTVSSTFNDSVDAYAQGTAAFTTGQVAKFNATLGESGMDLAAEELNAYEAGQPFSVAGGMDQTTVLAYESGSMQGGIAATYTVNIACTNCTASIGGSAVTSVPIPVGESSDTITVTPASGYVLPGARGVKANGCKKTYKLDSQTGTAQLKISEAAKGWESGAEVTASITIVATAE